ncbi:MAG TPA: glycosyltransferase family 39 protein [Candidatus Binataceae bacterium]|nr:glycosyltransferase family 39 protein [Candidatus Binataceae bacterium]
MAERNLSETAWRWLSAGVLVLTAILYFARLGARALWASEFRWAEISREMLLTHDYFWPTINGRVYFDKPLGSYWLVIASTWITGRMDEAAARIPCAIAGLLAVALLIALARHLYDLETGVIAGFILATSFSFVFWSRNSSADVETIAGELAVLLIFLKNEQRPGPWVVPMWLVMALTSLMKGLLGFVLPLIVIGVYACLAEGWAEFARQLLNGPVAARLRWLIDRNRWFFNWYTPLAIVLAAIVYYAPFAISHARTGSEKGIYMVYRENVERYFSPFDHRGPIYLYVYVIFALMAPWSAFLPAALVNAYRNLRRVGDTRQSDRFVQAFFWATFVFFTLSGSRRSYYVLPILPAGAILVARIFHEKRCNLDDLTSLLMKIGYGVIVAGVAVAVVIFMPPRWVLPGAYASLPPAPDRAVFAACWLGSAIAIAYALLDYRNRRVLLSVCAISYFFMFYIFVFAIPAGDQWRGERPFADRIRQIIDGNSGALASYKAQPPVFYLGLDQPVPQYDRLAQLDTAVAQGSVKWIVVRQRDLDSLNLPTHVAAREAVYPWDPREHRLNAMVLLAVTR